MVHYIRFLKVPRVHQASAQTITVVALITITTDLGDALMLNDAKLMCRLVAEGDQGKTLARQELKWIRGNRELKLSLTVKDRPYLRHSLFRLHVFNLSICEGIPSIIGLWSSPFLGTVGSCAAKIVARSISTPHRPAVNICEEAGTSLSAHIWDAAVGCMMLFRTDGPNEGSMPALQQILMSGETAPIKILELGSGCGVVGIALATWFSNCKVWLTDQIDAQELLSRNIELASPAKRSSLMARTLDWFEETDISMLKPGFDLVVVSDCIYNADSCPALVKKLTELCSRWPALKIFIARKKRHESEQIFFTLMQEAQLQVLEQTTIELEDHGSPDLVEEAPRIEFYLYSAANDRS